MVYINSNINSNIRTDGLEVVDISGDHEDESETCAGVRSSGTLVPHHRSLTFTNFFPWENTGPNVSTYRRKETYRYHPPYELSPRLQAGSPSRRTIRSRSIIAAASSISAWHPLGPRPQEPLPLHDEWAHQC